MKNYSFDGSITREVLENYLSRSVTAANLVNSSTMKDVLRMLKNIGAKFLGRASGVWEMEKDDEVHFYKSAILAKMVHEMDEEIILQSCVFEYVFLDVEKISIPAWVFDAFELPREDRRFRLRDMLFDTKPIGFVEGEEAGIPNIDKLEARLWFFYRAARYIDSGYEALHMGQVNLYSAEDKGYRKLYHLFDLIRSYARKNARRHMVLLDGHTHGISVNNRLLLDFHSIPFSRMPILDVKPDKLVFVKEGFSEGGVTPSGWVCETLPSLMEFDNWGGKFFHEGDGIPYEKRAFMQWWGYDQIAWFASQDEDSRNKYLEYAHLWTEINDCNAYCQMPVMRTLGNYKAKLGNGRESLYTDVYKANRSTEACPLGFGQEDTIKALWETEDSLRTLAAETYPRIKGHFGEEGAYDKETGMKLPARIILYGSFQHFVGAVDYDSNSELTRMYHRGNGLYRYLCILPFAGEYEYAVAPYGTLSHVYSIDRYPRSGNCVKAKITIDKDNTIVKFDFDYIHKILEAKILSS